MMQHIYVIETHDDMLLGTVEFVEGGIVVRNGFVGRPTVVPANEVVSMKIAEESEDIEEMSKDADYIKVG